MSEEPTNQIVVEAKAKGAPRMAQLVYILYLASIVFGVTGIIGVIMAYVNKGDSPDWVKSHYQFQIRTFWISILFAIIGMITMPIMIGMLVFLGLLVWYIMRCVKGMKYLAQEEPVPDPKTWIW